ncbi:MAG: DUF2167 domain-containing protein [Planctomycetota bacterium]
MSLAEFASSLTFETGEVFVHGGKVRFDLPEGWGLLQSGDAQRVVEDLWGNPEDPYVVAFLDPPSPVGRLEADYGIIVYVDQSGHIKDDDAAGIDYDELLTTLQDDARAANPERVRLGYESLEIIGWASPPRYDAGEKKLYWAKELSFGGEDEHTLNSDVRILGRRGYVMLQAVATMAVADEVNEGMKLILERTSFSEGHRYSDFDSSIDTVAAVGIGGLIAGKVLAKTGFLAVLAKFSKVIILAVVGLYFAARRFLPGEERPTRASRARRRAGTTRPPVDEDEFEDDDHDDPRA